MGFVSSIYLFFFAVQRILCGTSEIKKEGKSKQTKKKVYCILQRKQEIKEETFAVGLLT